MNAQTNKINLTDSTVDCREVTGGINGYPVPVEGHAVFTDSIEQLKELAESTGTEIHEFWWKNGWQNCEDNWRVDIDEYREQVIAELNRLANRRGEGDVFDLCTFDREQWINEIDLDEWEEECPGFGEDRKTCAAELQKLKDDGVDAAKTTLTEVVDWHTDLSQSYCEDVNNYQLGIFLPGDEWEVELTSALPITYSHATRI